MTSSTPPQRPRTLLALLVFFAWIEGRALLAVILPQWSASYQLYEALGIPWVHYTLNAVTFALAVTATRYLWNASSGWFESSMVALGAYAAMTIGGAWYTVRHLGVARSSYGAARGARGFPMADDRLALLFTPGVIWSGALAMLLVLSILAALAWRQRAFAIDE